MKHKVALFFLLVGQIFLLGHSVVPHHHHGGMVVINCHHDHGHDGNEGGMCALQFSLYDIQDDDQQVLIHLPDAVAGTVPMLPAATPCVSFTRRGEIPFPPGPPPEASGRRGPPFC